MDKEVEYNLGYVRRREGALVIRPLLWTLKEKKKQHRRAGLMPTNIDIYSTHQNLNLLVLFIIMVGNYEKCSIHLNRKVLDCHLK